MKLGFRKCKLDKTFEDLFAFAQELGAESLQLDGLVEDDIPILNKLMQKTRIAISSIGAMSTAMLGPDIEKAKHDQEKVGKAISIAQKLEVPCVSQFAGNNCNKTFEENIRIFEEVFVPLAKKAEDAGVCLVFENCPLVSGIPPVVHNFVYCPGAWEAMFNAVPSEGIGLEFDTAHLHWLGIDIIRCVHDFAKKIKHVHLKDCIIDSENGYRYGRLGHEFYSYQTPGNGQIDFKGFITALKKVDYEGSLTLDLRPTTEETIRNGMKYMQDILKQV